MKRIAVLFSLAVLAMPAYAIPQFARKYNIRCTSCHSVPPQLNKVGLDFMARGYRMPAAIEEGRIDTAPLAIWLAVLQEEQTSNGFSERFLSKVELISGGPIGDSLSYFVEWRMVSLQTRSDGTLRDRSGRFEDAFLTWQIDGRSAITIGQYRALNQIDVSRKLSVSTPALFGTSLPGDPSSNSRIQSLRAFSPAGRSPGVTYEFQSIEGESPSDGLFHFVTLPFPGELSFPLTPEARSEASFELEGSPKGIFLETFYRQGLTSIGLHGFYDDDRWLLTGLGTLNVNSLLITGGIGVDEQDGAASRVRSSLQLEYLLPSNVHDRVRAAVGFRVEHVTNSGRKTAYIPYFAMSGPNKSYTFLLNIEYRGQEDNRRFVIGCSLLF
ncbi:MAG: hypothetical protein IH851_06155 [Armatimonadetes bacterium]|nr:hypothetical protein [Armatimonadota bacterium]